MGRPYPQRVYTDCRAVQSQRENGNPVPEMAHECLLEEVVEPLGGCNTLVRVPQFSCSSSPSCAQRAP